MTHLNPKFNFSWDEIVAARSSFVIIGTLRSRPQELRMSSFVGAMNHVIICNTLCAMNLLNSFVGVMWKRTSRRCCAAECVFESSFGHFQERRRLPRGCVGGQARWGMEFWVVSLWVVCGISNNHTILQILYIFECYFCRDLTVSNTTIEGDNSLTNKQDHRAFGVWLIFCLSSF